MTSALEQIQWLSDTLLAGRYEDLARFYVCPLPVYHGKDRIVIEAGEPFQEYLRELHMILRKRGYGRFIAELTAQQLPLNDRFRVWVRWKNPQATGDDPRCFDALYYCSTRTKEMQIEMIEFKEALLPELFPIWEQESKSA